MTAHRDIRSMLPRGYRIEHKGKHPHLVGPDGKPVRTPDGRKVVFSNDNGGRSRTIANYRAVLHRLGIL